MKIPHAFLTSGFQGQILKGEFGSSRLGSIFRSKFRSPASEGQSASSGELEGVGLATGHRHIRVNL
jgi:hypothetical protein